MKTTCCDAALPQERSVVVATYALCGFSNLSSMGLMLGALGGMAPRRRPDISSLVFRAMIAGNVACFMTACIAGNQTNIINGFTVKVTVHAMPD